MPEEVKEMIGLLPPKSATDLRKENYFVNSRQWTFFKISIMSYSRFHIKGSFSVH